MLDGLMLLNRYNEQDRILEILMRLSFRVTALLGRMIVLLSSIQLAFAQRSSESFPVSQAQDASVVFEQLTIEDGLS